MGKPYQKELERLPGLYEWALAKEIKTLSVALRACHAYPMVAIGSGGSFTSAYMAASLHQDSFCRLARPITPLEAAYSPRLENTAVLFLTAEGKNPDILGAFELVVRREPRHLIVLCASSETPLAAVARNYRFVRVVELDVPTGKDGFVATNSLVASAVLLTRAYVEAARLTLNLPASLTHLLNPRHTMTQTLRLLERSALRTLQRDNFIVLHGPTCHAAAVDLESKFSEAALGTVQLSDYRNFAHGRHHWLHKHHNTSGIIAFISPTDIPLAERTLALIPHSVPITRIPIAYTDLVGSLSALIYTLHITAIAGKIRGIDPGQPRIPLFGRKIYHLKHQRIWTEAYSDLRPTEAAAIWRKSGKDLRLLFHDGTIELWKTLLRVFINQLANTYFQGIICDYDGTLCEPGQRLDGQISERLNFLLRKGYAVAIATGRGKSVRDDLRRFIDRQYWPRILIGFYNGADISTLDDDSHPDTHSPPSPALTPVVNAIKADPYWAMQGELTFRKWQVTLKPSNPLDDSLWDAAARLSRATGTTLVRSSHSIDIVPSGVSKTNLTQRLIQDLSAQSKSQHILILGDLGRPPGNDADLLASPFGLSVDEVSRDPKTCWNLALPGHRGVQASLDYLNAVVGRRYGFVLDVKKLGLKVSV